jgi:alkanesulfonate monooxygenase SsuD/methylene tetrahydromethanopterin reductase-like flavin-dependent oxidoreductase (luciferase family)
MLPHPVQMPHPPLYMAGGTERSIGYCGRNGFGLMLSTLPGVDTLAAQIALYERELATASAERRKNPAAGNIDIARWVYVADSDAQARADTEEAIVRHIAHFGGSGTAGYLGSVSEKGSQLNYDDLLATTLLHGSAETVIAKLRELEARTGMTSLLLHYPPYYGREKTMKSLKLFAERVIPPFRAPRGATAAG